MSHQHQQILGPVQSLHMPGGLRIFIQRYDVPLFFLFTFIFSWSIWFMAPIFPAAHDWRRIQLIAGTGPALSAILLSLILQPGRDPSLAKRHLAVFAIAFVGAAAIAWLDSLWWDYPLTGVEITFDLVLALFAAYTLTGALSPRQGVRQLLRRLAKWRFSIGWILFAILLWPAIVLIANEIAKWSGISVPANPTAPDVPVILLIVESFLWMLLFGGPLSEEPGWRGFALPRLQARTNPLVASLWIGVMWGLWHLPLHLLGAYPGGPAGFMIRLQEIPSAIIFTWLFNRTKGSLLPVLFLHAARNATSLFLSRAYIPVFVLWLLLACLLVIWDKMWKPLPQSDSWSAQPLIENSTELNRSSNSYNESHR
ncbi:MAG TPA: type II CAAX endopeptidase family protein [Anaerolineales bacterium]|nr:type II CAAX endopeptidase family protein [Anaerolineales bacterium]